MKSKEISLEQLLETYNHPSTALFRAIELHTIYERTKDVVFENPSIDIGCGDGKIARIIFDSNFTYGLDNGDAQDMQIAISQGIYEEVFIESAEKMSLPAKSVGFVFSNCVIEHIPDTKAVLEEVSRILKPGGQFVFTVPSHHFGDYLYFSNKVAAWGLSRLSLFYQYRRNKLLSQFHCYSKEDWEQKLSPYSLELVDARYYVDKETLMLWDKMALEVYFKKILDKKAEEKVKEKYLMQIRRMYNKLPIKDGCGAALFLRAEKR